MKLWKATLKDKTIVLEDIHNPNWTQIQDQVAYLELDNNGQIIKLPKNMDKYIQGKTASANISNGKCTLESRYIGFKNGSNTILVRVSENTNQITIETSS